MSQRSLGRLLWVASLSILLSCRRGGHTSGMSDSTFVAIMANLRRIEADSTMDRMAQDSARRMVLRNQRVTPKVLEETARRLAQDPPHAVEVWQKIDQQFAQRQRPSPPPPTPSSSPPASH